MISGGIDGNGFRNGVQLFNWMTKESCELPPIPYNVSGHSLRVLDGVPVMCGGHVPCCDLIRNTCFKLNTTNNSWVPVSAVLFIRIFSLPLLPNPSRLWHSHKSAFNTCHLSLVICRFNQPNTNISSNKLSWTGTEPFQWEIHWFR